MGSRTLKLENGMVLRDKPSDDTLSAGGARQSAGDDHLEDRFKGNVAKIEMSRYIDLDIYHAVEKSHPFYVEMIVALRSQILELGDGCNDKRILEIGAGTGLATEEFIELPWSEFVALDLDQNCCRILQEHLGTKVTSVCGDAITYRDSDGFDFVFSVFAHDHIHPLKIQDFLTNVRSNLVPGGYYLVGAEFLPEYLTEQEWRAALYRYHMYIVEKALNEENFELAQIEISALKSGLYKIGDFKRDVVRFENEMAASGLILRSKEKIGPNDLEDVGGIFVYVYQSA